MQKKDIILLSIDPGYDRLGVAILREEAGKSTLLFSDCIQTNKKDVHEKRLHGVGAGVAAIIEKWKPEAVAIEELFFSKNQTTALLVSQALGVVAYEAARANLPVFYYKPVEVKVAVTGYGQSDKSHVISMVPKLIKMAPEIAGKKRLDDEFDAIAVGLTHLACRHTKEHERALGQLGKMVIKKLAK